MIQAQRFQSAESPLTCGDHWNYMRGLASNSLAAACSVSACMFCLGCAHNYTLLPWTWIVYPGLATGSLRCLGGFMGYVFQPSSRPALIRELRDERERMDSGECRPGWDLIQGVDLPSAEDREAFLEWQINQGLHANREMIERQRQMINRQTGFIV